MTGLAVGIEATQAGTLRRSRALIGLVWVLEAITIAVAALTVVLAALTAGWGQASFSIVWVAFTTIGGLIVVHQPRNPIGWIYCFVGLAGGISVLAGAYVQYGIDDRSYPLAGTIVMAWLAFSLPPLGYTTLFIFGFLLFPDGRLPSRRWRLLAWVAAAATTVLYLNFAIAPVPLYDVLPSAMNPFGVSSIPLNLVRVAGDVSFFLTLACSGASVCAMVVRLRNAGSELRQQLKWMTYAACLLAVSFVSGGLLSYFADVNIGAYGKVALIALPVTAAIAIFRYRLYDIDIVISKTVIYGTLAVFITTVYVSLVVGVGAAIGVQGKPSLALSIVSAAVVATVFQPVRERVERLAKRLVFGKRATPYEVLARFSERLAAIHPTEDVLPGMARLLAEGTGSARAEVWLLFGERLRLVASWPREESGPERGDARQTQQPDPHADSRTVPVRHHGEVLGALAVRMRPGFQLIPPEEKLLTDLAGQAGLVLNNARLVEDLRRSRERLITAQDAERRRLERDIRDRVEQPLASVAAALDCPPKLAETDEERQVVTELRAETARALTELRELAGGVYPLLLAGYGLEAALVAHIRAVPLPVTIEADGVGRLQQDVEAAVYFCCLEALQNVAKHAQATRVRVSLSQRSFRLEFRVDDDGVGFEPASTTRGSGLQNMADRAEALGGTVQVSSTLGHGTTVAGWIPARTVEPVP